MHAHVRSSRRTGGPRQYRSGRDFLFEPAAPPNAPARRARTRAKRGRRPNSGGRRRQRPGRSQPCSLPVQPPLVARHARALERLRLRGMGDAPDVRKQAPLQPTAAAETDLHTAGASARYVDRRPACEQTGMPQLQHTRRARAVAAARALCTTGQGASGCVSKRRQSFVRHQYSRPGEKDASIHVIPLSKSQVTAFVGAWPRKSAWRPESGRNQAGKRKRNERRHRKQLSGHSLRSARPFGRAAQCHCCTGLRKRWTGAAHGDALRRSAACVLPAAPSRRCKQQDTQSESRTALATAGRFLRHRRSNHKRLRGIAYERRRQRQHSKHAAAAVKPQAAATRQQATT